MGRDKRIDARVQVVSSHRPHDAMQGGTSTTHDIPPEIWNAIIVLLPPLDRLSCLSVARMFHDIAVPLVFEHVHITYGISSDCTLFSDAVDPYTPLSPGSTETQERRARAARSTSEFLQHLAATPELAKMVRRFTVRAISLSPEDVDCGTLTRSCLQGLPANLYAL